MEKMKHVARFVLPYVLLLVPSILKHLGLNFVLGAGSRYDDMYRDDMAEDFSSSHPHHLLPTHLNKRIKKRLACI